MTLDEARVGARVTWADGTSGAGTITDTYRHLPGCRVEWDVQPGRPEWGPEWVGYSELRLLPDEAQPPCCDCVCEHRCLKDPRVIGHQGCVACKWCCCHLHGEDQP